MLLSRQKQGRFEAPTQMLCAAWHHGTREASRRTEGFLCLFAQKKQPCGLQNLHRNKCPWTAMLPLLSADGAGVRDPRGAARLQLVAAAAPWLGPGEVRVPAPASSVGCPAHPQQGDLVVPAPHS